MAVTTDELHDHAVQAEKHLEQLATGLGQVGVQEQVLKFVTQAADIMRQLATGLAKGNTGVGEPDQPEPEPEEDAGPPASMDEAADRMMAKHAAARGR